MKRLLLLSIVAAIAVAAVALIGFRSSSGPDVASAAPGTKIEIDMVQDGSSPDDWCNPVQSSVTVNLGTDYKVAICLTDAASAPASFNIEVLYDDVKNLCTDVANAGTGLDDNPDANAGSTVWDSVAHSLGTVGWDCSAGGTNYPVCDTQPLTGPGNGRAFFTCGAPSADLVDLTLPFGVGVSSPIGVLKLHAEVAGVSSVLALGIVAVADYDVSPIINCPAAGADCVSGAVTLQEAPPTPTPTSLPSECDIGVSTAIAAVPPSLTMKVGAPPAIVNLSASFKNNGAVTQGAPSATCSFARVYAAEIGTGNPLTDTPVDPTKLRVRVEPVGNASAPYGDVCLACFPGKHPGWTAAQCVLLGGNGIGSYAPTPAPALWDYVPVPCDEGAFNNAFPFSLANHSCEDGIDNLGSEEGTCDWAGYSKLCVPPSTADVTCLDVQLIGLIPAVRAVLPPQGVNTSARVAKIECVERGTYPLVLAAGVGSTSTSMPPGPYYGPSRDPNPANDMTLTIVTVTCTKGPEMVKDCRTDIEGIQDSCNLWLMDPAFAGKTLPEVLPAADDNGCVIAAEGKGCLAVDVWLKSADDEDNPNDSDLLKECLGAWEHQVRFDHKILRFLNTLDPVGWLESEGRIANCTISVLAEDWILEGCVTKDDPAEPGMQLGPCGDGIIERMLIIPQTNDLIYRGIFRPTKDNGVVTNIVDDNCEITDIYGEPMADTLPGQLTPVCGDLHITVRMLEGDTDLDCDVDVVDDQAVAFRFGASWGLQLYNQWFDLEGPLLSLPDGDIDIKDLQFVFGRNYSTCQAPIPDDQAIPADPGQP